MNAIEQFLYDVLAGINSLVGNYGVSIIIFTMLMRILIMPFDYKSRKGMRKMALIQPKINELQKKYANDREKLAGMLTWLSGSFDTLVRQVKAYGDSLHDPNVSVSGYSAKFTDPLVRLLIAKNFPSSTLYNRTDNLSVTVFCYCHCITETKTDFI